MKHTFILIASAAILASCTKDHELLPDETPVAAAEISTAEIAYPPQSKGLWISDWENVSNWSKRMVDDGVVFYTDRATEQVSSEILNDGVVLVFARDAMGVNTGSFPFSQGAVMEPVKLPFQFALSPVIKDEYFSWFSEPMHKTIRLSYLTDEEATQIPDPSVASMQFRYIVIGRDIMDKLRFTPDQVRQMDYKQLSLALAL
ncbi:MAG TPA: hypothetical protein VFZ78_05520 [Flavisolibacter sp.]